MKTIAQGRNREKNTSETPEDRRKCSQGVNWCGGHACRPRETLLRRHIQSDAASETPASGQEAGSTLRPSVLHYGCGSGERNEN